MSRRPEAMAAERDPRRDLEYIRALTAPQDDALTKAYADARSVGGRPSVSPESGRMLEVLTAAIGARRALEIGAGAGYSGIWIAKGLPAGGRLETIEISEENAKVCRENYAAAGVDERVEILMGAALDVLPGLGGPYDLCFIDAVKHEYPAYLDHALRLVRPGGIICADNVLWQGGVSNPEVADQDTAAVREFNRRIVEDPRHRSHVLPVGDGLSVSVVGPA
ncbi:MAG: O-methyltransferase [Actinobacteria bacterium]|nr:O-methyltransferase [Actinomycetota bacterium]